MEIKGGYFNPLYPNEKIRTKMHTHKVHYYFITKKDIEFIFF